MKKMLSVIVPIYNSEEYLDRCIKSILQQTYKLLDIILVDDGSTDRSGEICDMFAQYDSRVSVYHRENSGTIAARSFGVSVAKSDLVTFVDSDDWIDEDMYYEMIKPYGKELPDIISSGIIYNSEKGYWLENDIFDNRVYDKKEIKEQIVPIMMYSPKYRRRVITPSVGTKIFKKGLLSDVLENVNSQIVYGEDAAITYICIAKADSIAFVEKARYHYCTHENSQVTSYSINCFEKIKKFQEQMELKLKELGVWEQTWYSLKQYVKLFLSAAIDSIYGIDIGEPAFPFPFELIKEGSRVVIYGAGRVGKSYYKKFFDREYGTIAGWIDKNHESLSAQGYNVKAPEKIIDMKFDYVVLAVEKETIANNIKVNLETMGVFRDKIIWKNPKP